MTTSEAPPYLRIAAELRAEIETGRLAPGSRVPSTREVTRRWGVAMATATKALAALRQEGLVTVVPGVGTVVASAATSGPAPRAGSDAEPTRGPDNAGGVARPPAPPLRRPPAVGVLTLDGIADAAVAVADAEGLGGVSMRRVATELGVATMSLYRYVADKDDLVTRMIEAAISPWDVPIDDTADWRARLELAARALWATLRRHPWLATALSIVRPQPIAGVLPYTEVVLGALTDLGLPGPTVITAHITLFQHVCSTAVHLELERDAEAVTGLDGEEWKATQLPTLLSLAGGGTFPVSARVFAQDYDLDLDAVFEFGLHRLLDGLAVLGQQVRQESRGRRPNPELGRDVHGPRSR